MGVEPITHQTSSKISECAFFLRFSKYHGIADFFVLQHFAAENTKTFVFVACCIAMQHEMQHEKSLQSEIYALYLVDICQLLPYTCLWKEECLCLKKQRLQSTFERNDWH